MRKVRWGVLSTAKIGIEKVIPAMQQCEHLEIVAIASSRIEKTQAAARKLGIQRVYGSYEDLLNAPEIDAVYIPLPNHLHVPWSIKALEARKHVLCEKPPPRPQPKLTNCSALLKSTQNSKRIV